MPGDDSARYRTVFIAVVLLLCVPIAITPYPALVDYPNHLARTWIIARYASDAGYQATYVLLPRLLPNMAMDLIVPPLLSVVGLVTAGKIFLILTVLVFAAGCHVLGRALHGTTTWLAPVVAFFSYNSLFLYGYANFAFSVGLYALAFAAWLACRPRWTALRLLGVALLAFAAFVAHLGAYAFLGVSVAAVSAGEFVTGRRHLAACMRDALPLVPTLAFFVLYARTNGPTSPVVWNTLAGKLIGLAAPVRSYSTAFDIAFTVACVVLLVLAIRWSRSATVTRPAWAAAAALLVAFVLTPKVMFTSWGADVRFALPATLLLILGLTVDVRGPRARALVAAALMLGALRVGAIWSTWRVTSRQVEQAASLFPTIAPGARVYPAFYARNGADARKIDLTMRHVVFYAVPDRHIVVPSLFAIGGQQPLVFRRVPQLPPDALRFPDPALRDYDYVWAYALPPTAHDSLARRATLVGASGPFSLWKIAHQSRESTLPESSPFQASAQDARAHT